MFHRRAKGIAHRPSAGPRPTQADKPPLLLLDEVAAHLDEHRRAALIEELLELNTQVFLTGTDADLFKAFAGRAQVFEVKDGKIYLQPG